MARTPDPNRLRPEEATKFRRWVAEMRSHLSVSNSDLAQELDCSEDTIVSLLRDSRGPGKPNALLAASAHAILRVLQRMATRKKIRRAVDSFLNYENEVIEEGEWLYRAYFQSRRPAVFVPPQDMERFAEVLTDAIADEIPRARQRRALVTKAIVKLLRRDSAAMLDAWFNSVGTRVEHFIGQANPRKKGWITDPPPPPRKRWKGRYSDPFTQKDPSLFAVEVLALAVNLYKPKSKKGSKKR